MRESERDKEKKREKKDRKRERERERERQAIERESEQKDQERTRQETESGGPRGWLASAQKTTNTCTCARQNVHLDLREICVCVTSDI